MAAAGVPRAYAEGFSFTECPRWHDGRLWFSDFYQHRVVAVDGRGGVEEMARVDTQPSGLGWLPDGRLLIVSMLDRRLLLREKSGRLERYADLSLYAQHPINDMVVDRQGRAYVGNFGFDLIGGENLKPTVLVKVDTRGDCAPVADDMHFPNGAAITPDGGTLIIAESMASRLSAFRINPDGGLGQRRVWASLGPVPPTVEPGAFFAARPFVPDGLCLDAEGAIWVADAGGGRVVRVAEGGRVLQEITVAPLGAYACMLGGSHGRTLFICFAPGFADRPGKTDGGILAVEVDVPHAGLP